MSIILLSWHILHHHHHHTSSHIGLHSVHMFTIWISIFLNSFFDIIVCVIKLKETYLEIYQNSWHDMSLVRLYMLNKFHWPHVCLRNHRWKLTSKFLFLRRWRYTTQGWFRAHWICVLETYVLVCWPKHYSSCRGTSTGERMSLGPSIGYDIWAHRRVLVSWELERNGNCSNSHWYCYFCQYLLCAMVLMGLQFSQVSRDPVFQWPRNWRQYWWHFFVC